MSSHLAIATFSEELRLISTFCQICTALVAAAIGVITFRYTRQQSTLSLINHNNGMANSVNQALLTSADARLAFGRLRTAIVGCPDDAILFMYLNYVHNTYRMHRVGAVSSQVWLDTLGSCVTVLASLRREQVVALLSRGYEEGFKQAVLSRTAMPAAPSPAHNAVPIRPARAGNTPPLRDAA
ncbi:MAG: hypothetical protein JOY70_03755 [Acidisphaera sp.]|nr:hypothetical protein [Acidisphaera sp.]MBV9811440.1 hypothetical protein [Acetobacteraceae bacterium]